MNECEGGCGTIKAAARSWYQCSPVSGKPSKGAGWCGNCYERLHAKHIRELYLKRDEAEALVNGTSERKAVRIW